MNRDSETLKALKAIAEISNQPRLKFETKLNRILEVVVACMSAEKGSIILVKNRQTLEVVASTRPDLIGCRQPLSADTPSAWVVKNKQLLYVDARDEAPVSRKIDRYKRDAFLLVPIQRKGTVMGVLCVTEKIGQDAFTNEEQAALLMIVGNLISSLENERLNRSLKQSKQTLKKKNQQLKRLEQVRTELFNMLIHDLKGPISEVIANLDILSYTASSENKEYVDAALSGCDTLYRMIADLLDIARLEDGSLKIVQERIDPCELVREVAARIHGQAGNKAIKIVESCPDGCPFFLGDRGLMLRVLQNLMVNAVNYAPEGSEVKFGYTCDQPREICFYVIDDGPGIKPEYHDAIFNKYFQIHKKQAGGNYSTGLGLAFCKMAVEAHSGSILVKSDGVRGSRFNVCLPAEKL